MNRIVSLTLIFLVGLSGAARTQTAPAWIAESNTHAQVLLDVLARFAPEGAGQFGVAGLDQEVTNLSEETFRKGRDATRPRWRSFRPCSKPRRTRWCGRTSRS